MRRHHATGSGKIIRYCMQQLEKVGVVKRDKKHDLKKLSRFVTKEGQTDLNRIATQVALESFNKK
jgi:small subunit ribosomal protein S19e